MSAFDPKRTLAAVAINGCYAPVSAIHVRGVRIPKQPLRKARGLVLVSVLQKARTFLGATTNPNSRVHLITGQLHALASPQQLAGIVAFQRSEAFRRNSVEQYGHRIPSCSLMLR